VRGLPLCSLVITESLLLLLLARLTIGTHRPPTSEPSATDHQVLDWRLFPGAGGIQDVRDFRRALSAQIQEVTRRGLQRRLRVVDQFFTDIDEVLTAFDHAAKIVQPLPGLSIFPYLTRVMIAQITDMT
jgi:hypothetical protein